MTTIRESTTATEAPVRRLRIPKPRRFAALRELVQSTEPVLKPSPPAGQAATTPKTERPPFQYD